MPVYEYQCTECGQIIEAFQKISESPLTVCTNCKGGLKKLISQSAFHLKGTGWYVTDYGGKKSGTEMKTDTNSAALPEKPKSDSTSAKDSKD
ncbi:MAG: zinc ribbon domain-containing protein [Proteobacteria bacterium]|nr:zinc ribbon domain-containing protein [Pseudomonadota bacterium]MBU1389422.1 zinc ribbon domain-containing protein [Pseudomonadota bacterium]MBU1541242.1 zinc ribbon domain-containing protein [Pseudomonadota bacterium]MBU2481054.1 zinc ribbon domain-containing protein [Pseudomonadota bacterium]